MKVNGEEDCNTCNYRVECWKLIRQKEKELEKIKNIEIVSWYKNKTCNINDIDSSVCDSCG